MRVTSKPRWSERPGKIISQDKETFAITFGPCSCSRLGLTTGTSEIPYPSPFPRSWQDRTFSLHRLIEHSQESMDFALRARLTNEKSLTHCNGHGWRTRLLSGPQHHWIRTGFGRY